jgi:hypothetical protein
MCADGSELVLVQLSGADSSKENILEYRFEGVSGKCVSVVDGDGAIR